MVLFFSFSCFLRHKEQTSFAKIFFPGPTKCEVQSTKALSMILLPFGVICVMCFFFKKFLPLSCVSFPLVNIGWAYIIGGGVGCS
jgi:hypothetical protein